MFPEGTEAEDNEAEAAAVAKPEPDYFTDPSDSLLAEAIKPHSRDKHGLVRRYVDICRGVRVDWIQKRGQAATYIDLYCGPGRVCAENGTAFEDASSLVAWNISQHPPKGKAQPFSHMFLADKRDDLRQAAEARLLTKGAPVHTRVGAAEHVVREIVADLPRGFQTLIISRPAGKPHSTHEPRAKKTHFALLDPYGIRMAGRLTSTATPNASRRCTGT